MAPDSPPVDMESQSYDQEGEEVPCCSRNGVGTSSASTRQEFNEAIFSSSSPIIIQTEMSGPGNQTTTDAERERERERESQRMLLNCDGKVNKASRYATLGLNRLPIYTSRPPNPIETVEERQTTYQRTWMQDEEENLTELQDMLLAPNTGVPPRKHNSGWQPLNKIKTSKFTTGLLTTSGWQPIENSRWNDKDKQVCNDEARDRNAGDSAAEWLDEKYFDHDRFLKYVKSCNRRERGRTQQKKTARRKSGNDVGNPPVGNSSLLAQRSLSLPWSWHSTSQSALEHGNIGTETGGSGSVEDALPQKSVVTLPTVLEERKDVVEEEYPITLFPAVGSNKSDKWELAEGNTSSPIRIGLPEPQKLTIHLRNISTQNIETHTFTTIKHSDINWDANLHIHQLNQWRTKVFRDRCLTIKPTQKKYAPEQNTWLLLFHKKIKAAVERGSIVKLPGPSPVTEALNYFFQGKIFTDALGQALPQRELRDESSVRWKLQKKGSAIWTLRDVTRKLLEGKYGGMMYVPIISDQEFQQYCQDGSVVADDVEDGAKNAAVGRARWQMQGRKRNAKDCNGEVADAEAQA